MLRGPTHVVCEAVVEQGIELVNITKGGLGEVVRIIRSGEYTRNVLLLSAPRTVGTWFCKCFANGILS